MLPRAGGLLSSHPHRAANGASDTPRQRRIPCWVGPGTAAVPAAGHDRPRGELETPGRAGLAQRSQRVGIDVGPSGLVAPGWHSQATLGRHPLGGRVHTHAPGRPSTAARSQPAQGRDSHRRRRCARLRTTPVRRAGRPVGRWSTGSARTSCAPRRWPGSVSQSPAVAGLEGAETLMRVMARPSSSENRMPAAAAARGVRRLVPVIGSWCSMIRRAPLK